MRRSAAMRREPCYALVMACGPRTAGLLGLLGLALGLWACGAPPPAASPSPSLLRDAHRASLELPDPMELPDEVAREVGEEVGTSGDAELRLLRLASLLRAHHGVPFTYAPHETLTARRAYALRRGDCMSFTLLFIALARQLGLPAYVVHVTRLRSYYERGGISFVSSHVAAGYGHGPGAVVLDFSDTIDDYRLSLYEAIDDDAARALFFNNMAVDALLAGRLEEAERLLSFLSAEVPELPELPTNLGVVLNRLGRHDEAREVLGRAIDRFPLYKPLYTNAMEAARRSGRPDEAEAIAARGRAIEEDDPHFHFAHGLALFEARRYAEAVEALEAAREGPPSAELLGWLARAYAATGDRARADAVLAEAKRAFPGAPALTRAEKALEQETP